MWVIEQEHKRDHDRANVALQLRESDGFMQANVRWDGCMQIWIENVSEEGNKFNETLHTCDIHGLIDKLQDLQRVSQEFFEFRGYWRDDDKNNELSP